MFRWTALCVAAAALTLGGCDMTTSDGSLALGTDTLARAYTSTKSAVGLSDAATAVTNAASGGLIDSKLGAQLNSEDRRLANEAELTALDRGAPGAPVPWRNEQTGRFGNIVAGPVYSQKGLQCRGFSHTIIVNGDIKSARGTACKSPEGTWATAAA